jgi:leader peptidase (prepilin peptidase)/N-methyltransferase
MKQAGISPAAAAAGILGVVAGGVAGTWLPTPLAVATSAALCGLMRAIAAEDFRRLRVPNVLVLLAAAAGLAFACAEAVAAGADPFWAAGRAVLSGLLCGGALYLLREAFFRARGVDGLGLGDVKLGASGGVWLGWELFAVAVLLAAVGALVFVATRTMVEGAWPSDRKIPLALYLAPAVWLCWYGSRLFSAV